MAFLVKWFGEAGLDEDVVNDSQHAQVDELDSTQAYCLYVSHLLSMWNSRMYEFGVVSWLFPVEQLVGAIPQD